MKTISAILVIVGFVLIQTSCSVLPICYSTKIDNTENDSITPTTYIDRNTNLIYNVCHDKNNLQVTLLFDTLGLQKIQHSVFYIYFDPKGKKKKDISLKIFQEGGQAPQNFNSKEKPSGDQMPDFNSLGQMGMNRMDNLNKRCEREFTSAIWKTKDNIYAFDMRYSISPIHITTMALDHGLWQVKVIIPLSELSDKTMESISLGVETPKSSNSASSQMGMGGEMSMGGGMGGPMGGGGMPGGGFGGGMPGGGGPGGMSGGTPPGMNGQSGNSGQLSSWIKVYFD